MNLSNFGSETRTVLGTVAPLLATAVGGPLAGTAVSMIMKGLGLSNPKDAEAAIMAADPQTNVALQKIEADFKQHMVDINVTEDQLEDQDRESARARQVATRDPTPSILVYGTTIGFFLLLFALLKWNVPEENKAVLYILTGILGAVWKDCVTFQVGSSRGSVDKTQALVAALSSKTSSK
jgi:hypothetical protein